MKINFNAADYAKPTFMPLPAGSYVARVDEIEEKSTKSGDGQYLQITWEILDGEFAGRKIWDRLNVVNPNETAQRIGRERLIQLAAAAGIATLTDTNDLYRRVVTLRLIVKSDANYGDRNDVKGYGPAPAGTSQAAPAAPAAASVPPWKRAAS